MGVLMARAAGRRAARGREAASSGAAGGSISMPNTSASRESAIRLRLPFPPAARAVPRPASVNSSVSSTRRSRKNSFGSWSSRAPTP
jgi:hypothetical protein